jgi:hypothetical protein
MQALLELRPISLAIAGVALIYVRRAAICRRPFT